MPIYKFGYIIRQRREDLGYTQEELAEGICSVPTLSRIENGERLPTKDHFEILLQRLGYSESVFYTYVDANTWFLHEQKFKVRQAIILEHFGEAQELLDEYKRKMDHKSPLSQQFVLLYDTLASPTSYTVEERLTRFEAAILLTCTKYREKEVPKILSYEEIIILNNIAGCYQTMGKFQKAINILSLIKKHYENGILNPEEILRTQPMILYNLSKCLGLAGKYTECIEICNLGIRIARETGRCNFLERMLYNRAWSLSKRNYPGDTEQSKESVKLAFYMANAMGKLNSVEHYKQFIEKTFLNQIHCDVTA